MIIDVNMSGKDISLFPVPKWSFKRRYHLVFRYGVSFLVYKFASNMNTSSLSARRNRSPSIGKRVNV